MAIGVIVFLKPISKCIVAYLTPHTSETLPPIPDSRFPIPDSRFPVSDSRFPIPDSLPYNLPVSTRIGFTVNQDP
ncbi:MAG: hypothetical protein F6J98_01410 [Moorea sp. SIO4G2]|nr:hypothetical protein [Moorena sp. SIO4G2]